MPPFGDGSVGVVLSLPLNHAKIKHGVGVLGLFLQHLLKLADRAVDVVVVVHAGRHFGSSGGILGIDLQSFAKITGGFLELVGGLVQGGHFPAAHAGVGHRGLAGHVGNRHLCGARLRAAKQISQSKTKGQANRSHGVYLYRVPTG